MEKQKHKRYSSDHEKVKQYVLKQKAIDDLKLAPVLLESYAQICNCDLKIL